MFANKNNSSIHSINSDRDISMFRKVLWFLLNFKNDIFNEMKSLLAGSVNN